MKTLILSEIKRRLFSSASLLVLFVIFAAMMINMNEANNLRASRPFSGHNMSNSVGNAPDWIANISEERKAAHPIAVYSFNLFRDVSTKRSEVGLKNDYVEYSRLGAFNSLLYYKMYSLTYHPLSEYTTAAAIEDLWKEVSGGVAYDDVDFRPLSSTSSTNLYTFILRAKYDSYLYQNEIEPVYTDENNNVTITYRYFYSILPMALLLAVIMFNYNSINGDKGSGVLKLILTQSISRRKYYISKWLGSVFHLVILILIPPVIMSFILGVKNGFITLKYPLTYVGGITSRLVPIINYHNPSKTPAIFNIHPRYIGHVAYNGSNISGLSHHPEVEVIPFYQFIIIAIVLVFFFVAFAVALGQLISSIINNEIISLGINIIVFLLTMIISMPLTLGKRYNLSPITMLNPLRIIEGTYNVTVLTAIIILSFSTIILLTAGSIYFRRKPI